MTKTARVAIKTTASAIQPMTIDAPTEPNEPEVKDPAMSLYTSEKIGKMTTTVKARMMLMTHSSAAG